MGSFGENTVLSKVACACDGDQGRLEGGGAMGLSPKPILAPRRLGARILDFQPLGAENFET